MKRINVKNQKRNKLLIKHTGHDPEATHSDPCSAPPRSSISTDQDPKEEQGRPAGSDYPSSAALTARLSLNMQISESVTSAR